jgi:hypothetical protein
MLHRLNIREIGGFTVCRASYFFAHWVKYLLILLISYKSMIFAAKNE